MNNDKKTFEIVKNMRKESLIRSQKSNIIGKEIFIPTMNGETRALIYKSKNMTTIAPVFFDLHGGGFIRGLPENDDWFCSAVNKTLDITVISIDYKLAPEYKCPSDKDGVYDVVSYVSSHSDDFGIDANNMSIGGHSAGANISTVVCMMAKEKDQFSFKCEILDYPPLDLFTAAEKKFYIEGAIPVETATLFNKCYRTEAYAKNPYCSPVSATIESLRNLPPAIVITAEMDSLRDEGEDYAQKLVKAGVETTAKRFYGVRHGFTISHPDLPESKVAYKMIIDGLAKYLLKWENHTFIQLKVTREELKVNVTFCLMAKYP